METPRLTCLLLLPLALPLLCLAAVSLVGFLGVLAISGANQVVASIKSGLAVVMAAFGLPHCNRNEKMRGISGRGLN